MSAWIFSPDGKDFCQFMTPNFPKTYVFDPNQPGAGGGIVFSYFPKCHLWDFQALGD